MPLRDVTNVVFDRGNGPFNEAAALEAYHLVAKMSDEEASEFVYHVVNEVVENTIVENRDLVQKHLDRTIAKALVYADLDAAAEGLSLDEREEVKKQLLTAVSKASQAEEQAWSHRDKSGRFTTFKHDVASGGRLSAEAGKALGIPHHPDHKNLTPEQRDQYRAQYLAVAHALEEHGGFHGNNDVRLHYSNGDSRPIVAASPHQVAAAINPHEGEEVSAVEVRPYKPTINGQVTDLTRSLGAGAEMISNGSMKTPPSGNSPFAQQWYAAHPTNTTQQMYNRIGAGSQLLDAVSVGQPKLQAAAKFGSFVGQHGPAAEQVFGPPSRRMAYRYRGTERKPDKALVGAYGQAVNAAKEGGAAPARKPGEDLKAYYARASQSHAERVPTWQEREAGREQIIGWLQKRTPSRALSGLQLAAGHTPPSEGVLLNADGQIVTTAVGVADDWYLPFNLKHLKSLKGGEYIRTRTTGGLTTEDIYTGLMTGARRVTVVSHSGVYSVEFDPELRGARRNNDKALRMTKRYGELLDAVQSGTVERQGLPPEAQRAIAREVAESYPDASPEERRAAINTLMTERKQNPETIQAKIDDLDEMREATESERELTPDEKTQWERDRVGLQAQKEYFYRLNGLGYKAAQDALKEQFPYYIGQANATWKVGEHTPIGGHDKGYVEPGALRPSAARANLFGGAQGSGQDTQPFMSARTADRARPMVDRYQRSSTPAAGTSPAEAPAGSSGAAGASPTRRPVAGQAERRLEQQQKVREVARKVKSGLGWVDGPGANPGGVPNPDLADLKRYHDMGDAEFLEATRQPDFTEKFDAALTKAHANVGDFTTPHLSEWEAVRGPRSGGSYSFAAAAASPEKLYDFSSLTPQQRMDAGKWHLVLTSGQAGTASENDLLAEVRMRGKLAELMGDVPASEPDRVGVIMGQLSKQGMTPTPLAKKMVENYISDPSALEKSMEGLQIQRYLNAEGLGASKPAAAPASIAAPATPRHATLAAKAAQLRSEGRTAKAEAYHRAGQALYNGGAIDPTDLAFLDDEDRP